MSFWFPNPLWTPAAQVYGFFVARRNRAFDEGKRASFTADFPVISVGNISVGGAGKTPVSEYLMRYFLEKGKKPAYLSRGYGRKTKGYQEVNTQPENGSFPDYRQYGDEAVQVAMKFPQARVAVAESRTEGLQQLTAFSPDVAILDDAFQHRAVNRNLDLVVLDASRPVWNDRLLPAGYLRESLNALHRADFLVVNKLARAEDFADWEKHLRPFGKPMAAVSPAWKCLRQVGETNELPLDFLTQKPVVALSGIGNPGFFHRQLTTAGAHLVHTFAFGDHHAFTEKDLLAIRKKMQEVRKTYPEAVIVTTEKDAMRLQGPVESAFLQTEVMVYPLIELVWMQGENELRRAIQQLM